ncbi:MAG: hypothetical protein WCF80_02115, partial [Pseudolabrys sp.]
IRVGYMKFTRQWTDHPRALHRQNLTDKRCPDLCAAFSDRCRNIVAALSKHRFFVDRFSNAELLTPKT